VYGDGLVFMSITLKVENPPPPCIQVPHTMIYYIPALLSLYAFVYIITRQQVLPIQNLVELVLMVKINVLESSMKELEETVDTLEETVDTLGKDHASFKEDMTLQPDTFQSWIGTFEYMLHGYYKIRGFIEVINTEVFTAKENRDWSQSDDVSSRDRYLKTMVETDRLVHHSWIVRTKDMCSMDWAGWNGTVTCRIKLYEGRDSFSRVEQAVPKAPSIKWERKLITYTKK
jgi:hypothetical protein